MRHARSAVASGPGSVGERVTAEGRSVKEPTTGSGPVHPLHRCAGPQRHVWLDPLDAVKCCAGYARVVRVGRDGVGDATPRYEWQPVASERTPSDAAAIEAVLAEANTLARTARTPEVDRPADASDGEAWFWPKAEHRAFLDAIAETEPDTQKWYGLRAGLLGLRLVDAFGARHFTGRTPSFGAFQAVRRAAEAMVAGSERRMILGVADAVREHSPDRGPSVQALLMHYGVRLEVGHQWLLALDVYGTVVRLARTQAQQDQLGECYLRIGDCWRRLGRRAAAAEARRLGRAAMRGVGSYEGELRIRIGEARDAAHWGDVVTAIGQLERLHRDARAARVGDVRASAVHELGNLLLHAGDRERAVRLLYDAFTSYGTSARREAACTDLGSALLQVGFREEGRAAYELMISPTVELEQQVVTMLHLLRLAAVEGDRKAFRRHRMELSKRELGAGDLADYYFVVGEGCRRFGRPEKAMVAFTRARRAAHAAGLPRLAAESTAALATETLRPPPPRRPSPDVAADVRAIASAIRQLAAAAPDWCRRSLTSGG
jgi:tetratricopeptide (TPR) repeat protein